MSVAPIEGSFRDGATRQTTASRLLLPKHGGSMYLSA
jgi:hypothetical protein